MNISIEKIKEENAKELAKEIKLVENQNKIFDGIAGNEVLSALTIKGISPHTAAADYFIEILTETESDAIKIFEDMELHGGGLLQICRIKDSCMSFRPEERVKEIEKERTEVIEAGVWLADISRCMHYATEIKFKAFCHLAGFLVELRAVITQPRIEVVYEYRRDKRGRVIHRGGKPVIESKSCANWHEHFTNIVMYAGTPDSAHFTAYNL